MPNSIRPSPVRDAIQVVLEIETINKARELLNRQINQRDARIKHLDHIAKAGLLIWSSIFLILLATKSELTRAHSVLMLVFAVIPQFVRWVYGDRLKAQNKRANGEDAAYLIKLTELERPIFPDPPIIPASASEVLDYPDLPNSTIISIGKHGA